MSSLSTSTRGRRFGRASLAFAALAALAWTGVAPAAAATTPQSGSAPPAVHAESSPTQVKATPIIPATSGQGVAESEARRLGMSVKWVNGNACTGISSSGCYYTGKGPQMTLSTGLRWHSGETIRNVVRHEAAHHAIAKTCGTATPRIVDGRGENVADAYAARYFGMSGRGHYGFNANDWNLAKWLRQHDKCAETQKTVTVKRSSVQFMIYWDSRNDFDVSTENVDRGKKFTYFQRERDRALVRDNHGNIGYIPMHAILSKKNYKSATIWNPQHQVKDYQTSDKHKVRYGEKVRIVRELSSRYYLALTDDGNGHVVSLRKSNMIKPSVTHKVGEGAVVYDITNGAMDRCDEDCVPAGSLTNHITRFDSNYEVVVLDGRSYAITRDDLRQVKFQGQQYADARGDVNWINVTPKGQLHVVGWSFGKLFEKGVKVRVTIDGGTFYEFLPDKRRDDVYDVYSHTLETNKVGFDWFGPFLTDGKHKVKVQSVGYSDTDLLWEGTLRN